MWWVKVSILCCVLVILQSAGEELGADELEARKVTSGRQRFVPGRKSARRQIRLPEPSGESAEDAEEGVQRSEVPERLSRPAGVTGRSRSSFLRRVVQSVEEPDVIDEPSPTLVNNDLPDFRETAFIGELARVNTPGGVDDDLNKVLVGEPEIIFKEEGDNKRTFVPRRRLNVNKPVRRPSEDKPEDDSVTVKTLQKVDTRLGVHLAKRRKNTRTRPSRPQSAAVKQDLDRRMKEADVEAAAGKNPGTKTSSPSGETVKLSSRKRIRRPPSVVNRNLHKSKPNRQTNRFSVNRKRIKMNMVDRVRGRQETVQDVSEENEETETEETHTSRSSPHLQSRKQSHPSRRRFSVKKDDISRQRHRLNIRKQTNQIEDVEVVTEEKVLPPVVEPVQTEVPRFTARGYSNPPEEMMEEHTALTDTSQWEEGRAQLKSARVPVDVPRSEPLVRAEPLDSLEAIEVTEGETLASNYDDLIQSSPLKSEAPEVIETSETRTDHVVTRDFPQLSEVPLPRGVFPQSARILFLQSH